MIKQIGPYEWEGTVELPRGQCTVESHSVGIAVRRLVRLDSFLRLLMKLIVVQYLLTAKALMAGDSKLSETAIPSGVGSFVASVPVFLPSSDALPSSDQGGDLPAYSA